MPSQEYRKSRSRIDKEQRCKVMQSNKYGKLRSCIGKDKQSNAIAQVWQVEITQGQGHSPSKEER